MEYGGALGNYLDFIVPEQANTAVHINHDERFFVVLSTRMYSSAWR
jgi:lipoprotein signal peptidase